MLLDRRTSLGLLIVAERSQELSCILQFNLVRQCYFMPTATGGLQDRVNSLKRLMEGHLAGRLLHDLLSCQLSIHPCQAHGMIVFMGYLHSLMLEIRKREMIWLHQGAFLLEKFRKMVFETKSSHRMATLVASFMTLFLLAYS
ncbi:hypothetical protein C4D60_Mb01t12110 [Musa balbisiana]|uniref:Uncharacterized protein n=1 Tax=Musa balbisiana TaxID=52838 RepID=A0A4S8JLL8_MUSBA|nr:hypothetical protein C4D60_Mb01t12110 [Musa balbisiana]